MASYFSPSAKNVYTNSPICFLGKQIEYTEGQKHVAEFEKRFSRLLWFTYRSGFPSLTEPSSSSPNSSNLVISDAGWGCMLRSGQMLLAAALLKHWFQEEDWLSKNDEVFQKILPWFNDTPTAPFSIHNIASKGVTMGKAIASWFGPTTISAVLKQIVQENKTLVPFSIYTTSHSAIDVDAVQALFGSDNAVLLLVPSRLGASSANPIYYDTLLWYLRLSWSLGFVGGKPNSAFYFVAQQEDQLFYLDPHLTRPTMNISENNNSDLSSFFCLSPRSMKIIGIDESLALGFYFRDSTDFQNFQNQIYDLSNREDFHPLFFLEKSKPARGHGMSGICISETGDDFDMAEGEDFEWIEKGSTEKEERDEEEKIAVNSNGDDFDM